MTSQSGSRGWNESDAGDCGGFMVLAGRGRLCAVSLLVAITRSLLEADESVNWSFSLRNETR